MNRQRYLAGKSPEVASKDFQKQGRWVSYPGAKASVFDVYFDSPQLYVDTVLQDSSIDVSIAACYCASQPPPKPEPVSLEYKNAFCRLNRLSNLVPNTRFHLANAALEHYLGQWSRFQPLFDKIEGGIENVYLIAFYVLKQADLFEKARIINPSLDYAFANELLLLEERIKTENTLL